MASPRNMPNQETNLSSHQTDDTDASASRVGQGATNLEQQTSDSDIDLEKQLEFLNGNSGTDRSPAMGSSKPLKSSKIVNFEDLDDSVNPHNWNKGRKWVITCILALATLSVTFTSSMFSTAQLVTAKEFGVGPEVTVLGTSLYVLGFAFGPIVWGPMSELYGRRLPTLLGVFGMSCFQIGVSVAPNLYTIMICRFWAGTFGSAPLAVISGCLADFWNPVERGQALGIFSITTFAGPLLAPVIGGFITESYLDWRWSEWITVIFGFFSFAVGFVFIPETYHPLILSKHAARIRRETQDWAIHAKAEEEEINAGVILEAHLLRPFKMIWQEPILVLVTLYMGLVYGILYLFFEAFPISFAEERGWSEGTAGLPFLSVMVGVFFGGMYIGIYNKKVYAPKMIRLQGQVAPEERLPPMMVGGVVFTVGLFWWAWSGFPNVHKLWVSQLLAGVPAGFGILVIFVQGLTYLVECYKQLANSAISASTFFRSLLGAGFPLFATAMYHKLGVPWATTLLAFLTLALIPVPVSFYLYGKKIRDMSKFVPNIEK